MLTEQQTKIPIEINHPKPSLVFPNYNDHGYAKISLDQDSINFVKANLETITDSLLRQQLWSSLWNMVRDQQLSSVDFLGLVRTKISMESNMELITAFMHNNKKQRTPIKITLVTPKCSFKSRSACCLL